METSTNEKIKKTGTKPLHISGAEVVIRCLLAAGADLVNGYPGGAIMTI